MERRWEAEALFELLETRFQLHVRSYNDDEIGDKELARFFMGLQTTCQEIEKCILTEQDNLTAFEQFALKTTAEIEGQAKEFCKQL